MRRLQTLLVAAALLGGSPAHANDAQRQFLDFGVNLGWAVTAVELYGDIPIVTDSIDRAMAHFTAAESMIGRPYSETRNRLSSQVARQLADYARATRGKSQAFKAHYLRQVWLTYYQSLRVIYRTEAGRAQMVSRSTCDSFMALTGYEFGRAQIYAGNPRTKAQRDKAVHGMRRAVDNGLKLAMDGYPPESRRQDKLCCSFGNPASWSPFLRFRNGTPATQYDDHLGRMQGVATGARVSCSGGAPGQVASNPPVRPAPPPPRGDPPTGGGHSPPGGGRGSDGGDQPTGSLPTGSFKTTFGTMTFGGRSSGRIATYTSDQGRIHGTLRGNDVIGHWVEKGSARRCKTTRDGSYYWGRADFQIDGDKLVGKWGYCDDAPTRSWTGTRIRTVIKR